ncbi:hypothetical protein SBADM41S_04165 [Streptomyces badius]
MEARIFSSQAIVCRFIRRVREALVTSVTWTPPSVPPVRFQMTQESMVPKRMSPRSARSRSPSTLSSSQRTLGPAKYEASGSPVSRRNRSWPTLRPSSLQSASVRVSCQTSALCTGSPVFLSHSRVVSRWLVMPIALTSAEVMPALTMAPATTSWTFSQISVASCSTQPGFGKICSCSFWSTETIRPSLSKTMQRLEVVPWSMAAMNGPVPWVPVVCASVTVCSRKSVRWWRGG